MHVLFDILLVTGTLIALAVLLGGLGLLLRRWTYPGPLSGHDLQLSPWWGWAAAIALLQVWHIWLPVDGRALALIALLGAIGGVVNARSVAAWLAAQAPRCRRFVPVAILAVLWVAGHTTTQASHPDSGLYHVPSVQWACSYPVIPGIGNLRNILAYNSSYFLYAAMLSAGPFVDRYHHLASGLLLLLVILRSLSALWRIVVQREKTRPAVIFDALILVPAIVCTMGVYGASPSPDVGVWVLTFIIGSEVFRLLDGGDASRPAWMGFMSIALLAAVGITVKLSLAVYAMIAILLAFLVVRRQAGGAPWGKLAALILVVGGVWVCRGMIQSGYPAYPCTIGGFPVAWRMDPEYARRNVDWLLSWGRTPEAPLSETLGTWKWLWPWLNRTIRDGYAVRTPLMLAGLGLLMSFLCKTRTVRRRTPALPWLFLLLPIGSLAYWFVTSPQVRFAAPTFWALGLGAVALSLRGTSRQTALAVVLAVSAVLFAQDVDPFEFVRQWRKDIGPIKRGHVVPVSTQWGLTVYVPAVKGEDCWAASLPNTTAPEFLNPYLRLRVAGDLSKGFVIDQHMPRGMDPNRSAQP